MFGNKDKTLHWLTGEQCCFRCVTPLGYATGKRGMATVLDHLTRIEHVVYPDTSEMPLFASHTHGHHAVIAQRYQPEAVVHVGDLGLTTLLTEELAGVLAVGPVFFIADNHDFGSLEHHDHLLDDTNAWNLSARVVKIDDLRRGNRWRVRSTVQTPRSVLVGGLRHAGTTRAGVLVYA